MNVVWLCQGRRRGRGVVIGVIAHVPRIVGSAVSIRVIVVKGPVRYLCAGVVHV